MRMIPHSRIDRRELLRLGVIAAMFGAAGCDDGSPKTITTPPPPNGNRARLKAIEEKADAVKSKSKAKK